MKSSDLRPYLYAILILFVMLSFLLLTGEVRRHADAIDTAARDVADNAAPSILYLSAARGEIRDLLARVERYTDHRDAANPSPTASFRAACAHIRQLTKDYQAVPAFPGEQALWERENRTLARLDEVVERLIALIEQGNLDAAKAMAHGELLATATEAIDAIMVIIEFNAGEANHLAKHIRTLRTSLARSTLLLSSLGVLWTLLAVLIIGANLRRWAQLRAAEHALALERAGALERFAGQVAHDILNPLSTVTYVLAAMERVRNEDQRQTMVGRGKSAVKRVQAILDGLLKFACAGAQPEPDARTEVNVLLAELGAELVAQASESSIELRIEPCPAWVAACNPGILNSLLGNLVHNAIKYMGEKAERRIVIRVLDRGPMLRFEVEDTGPGLTPGLESVVFDLHVRGHSSPQPGFGLGLATVKAAAQAHGGSVGVRSEPGRGCTFWFELPRRAPARSETSKGSGATALSALSA
jgi:signal transduction histidine kinase